MVNMTLAIPEKLKKEMNKHPETNWSEVARRAFHKNLVDLETLEKLRKLTEKSKLTEEDALMLGRLVNKGIAKRHGL